MKTSNKISIILIIAFSTFVSWSFADMVCMPCHVPPDAPEFYACPMICNSVPRWYSWLG